MMHPQTCVRPVDPDIGLGCVATAHIPAGTIVWVQDPLDRVLTPDEWHALPAMVRGAVETYAYRDRQGNFVLLWDHARYVNHSFHPNTSPTPLGFDIALRDIAAGEELRGDYGCLNITEAFTPLPEPGADRRTVRPDDLPLLAPRLDPVIAAAVATIPEVSQPLLHLLPPDARRRLDRILLGLEPLPSLLDGGY